MDKINEPQQRGFPGRLKNRQLIFFKNNFNMYIAKKNSVAANKSCRGVELVVRCFFLL